MDKLFQMRRDELRRNVLISLEKYLGFTIKYVLLVTMMITAIAWPGLLKQPIIYALLGISILITLVYTYLYKRFLSKYRVAINLLSICLEVLLISTVYCMLAENHIVPVVFFLFLLPVLRLILLYPSVSEFFLTAGLSSVVFLAVIAALSSGQLAFVLFWVYFGCAWIILSLGAVIAGRLLYHVNQSAKDHQLILQALQMVTALVEMAESTAHLHNKNSIFQKSAEVISRVMAVRSCVAWVCQNDKLCPVASEGLNHKQASMFQKMELTVHDIPIFERVLAQKAPVVLTSSDGSLERAVPPLYLNIFEATAMFIIPLTDNKRNLGCIALHWSTVPEKITPQELAILSGIATQIGINLENVYLLEELREKEEIRSRLLERIISIQEGERERIARELHDETGQILTALMVNLEILKTEPEFQSSTFQERLEEMSSLLSKNMKEIHDLSFDLHPKILNELGLVPAIRSYAKRHLERWGINFEITANNLNHSLSAKEEICLFRIAQEAITNIIRHAQAQQVDIEVGIDAESVVLNIRDDGKGFNVEEVLNSHNGETRLGLRGMEERVSFLEGQIDIKSEIGKGTEISVNIPLQRGQNS